MEGLEKYREELLINRHKLTDEHNRLQERLQQVVGELMAIQGALAMLDKIEQDQAAIPHD